MFLPYTGPSKNSNRKNRSAANAFVAVRAAAQRRDCNDPARGVVQWMQIPGAFSFPNSIDEPDIPPEPQKSNALQVGQSRPSPVLTRALGGQKFYPTPELGKKGPLTLSALSHYFDVLLPHDMKALGLGEFKGRCYGGGLLRWVSQHDVILHGLCAFTLCSLETVDRTDMTRHAVIYHRQKMLDNVHERMSLGQVDDVLIQAICLLIPVDDYLGYGDFGPAHRQGLAELVNVRGGFNQVGSSDVNAFGRNLQMSILVVTSMIEFHLQTRITAGHSPVVTSAIPLPYLPPELQTRISGLPPGFRELVGAGILSDSVVSILEGYNSWSSLAKGIEPASRDTWRTSLNQSLNNIEKCIIVTLSCLADDLSSMGTHPAVLIFRKPRQRAEVLYQLPELWNNPALVGCVIWMSTVTAIPLNRDIIDHDIQVEILRRAIRGRLLAKEWGHIQHILRQFYYDDTRAGDWEMAWNVALNNA